MADVDLFEQLHEFSWRGISFPVARFGTSFRQDLVQHKWCDHDGAHIEATGRDPLETKAHALFRNNLTPGVAETWGSGNDFARDLYPSQFRRFLAACLDRTSGALQHPEFGLINCKLATFDCEWMPDRRDGVDVQVSWLETSDDLDVSFEQVLAVASPVTQALINSLDIDSQIAQINNPALAQTDEVLSFSDATKKLTAVFDTASLISKQAGGSIDHIAYRLTRLGDSVSALGDPSNHPLITSIERMKSSLFDLRKQQLAKDLQVSLYVVPSDQTLAMLCQRLLNTPAELLKLNPGLAGGPVIRRLSSVRYFPKAA